VTIEQPGSQFDGLRDLADLAGASVPLPDPRHRSSERLVEEWRRVELHCMDVVLCVKIFYLIW